MDARRPVYVSHGGRCAAGGLVAPWVNVGDGQGTRGAAPVWTGYQYMMAACPDPPDQ
jgi:hypothetical protein